MITWSISAILESEEVLLVTFDQFTVSTAELFRIWGKKLFQIILSGEKNYLIWGAWKQFWWRPGGEHGFELLPQPTSQMAKLPPPTHKLYWLITKTTKIHFEEGLSYCIWVSFCRAGILAISCRIFSKSRRRCQIEVQVESGKRPKSKMIF